MAAWASSIICSEHLWCYHWQYSMSVGKNKKTRWRYSMTFHSVLFISFIFQHSSLLNLLYLPASDLDHIFNFLHSNLRKKKKKKKKFWFMIFLSQKQSLAFKATHWTPTRLLLHNQGQPKHWSKPNNIHLTLSLSQNSKLQFTWPKTCCLLWSSNLSQETASKINK